MSDNTVVVGAYGSGRTSGSFDPIAYIKKPEVILRLVGLLFSIIVIGCIADKGKVFSSCAYNWNMDACNFGIAIGVISILGLLVCLAVDAVIDLVSNIQYRKFMVIGDLGYSSFWGFMWLVCFIFLTDTWRRTIYKRIFNVDTLQAAIAFSFLCLLIYIALIILAAIKLRQGIILSSDVPQPNEASAPPPAYAGSVYSVGDAPFSPHPFDQGPAAGESGFKTDSPAY